MPRTALSPNEAARDRNPSSPINGSRLPVLGNAGAGASAGGAGTGTTTATKIGWSGGGGGGGGGAVPVICACCVTTVSGTSTILVAEIFIPFLKPQASVTCPSTLNFWSLGILNC